ncbi:MAG: hypothetical protein ACXVZW_08055 [Gaiellaceae bacterium]
MRHWNRALTTLAAAAAAGFLLWFSPHFHRWTTGGYWGVMALMAVAGVLIGLSQLHGRDGNPTASFLLAFLPVLVAAGWVILAAQPQGNWIRDHVLSWSGDMGIDHAVHNLGERVAVLAFGLGIVFGVTFEPKMVRRGPKKMDVAPTAVAAAPSPPPAAADPPVKESAIEEPAAQQAEADEQKPAAPPA